MGRVGLEPTTLWLRATCSTIELTAHRSLSPHYITDRIGVCQAFAGALHERDDPQQDEAQSGREQGQMSEHRVRIPPLFVRLSGFFMSPRRTRSTLLDLGDDAVPSPGPRRHHRRDDAQFKEEKLSPGRGKQIAPTVFQMAHCSKDPRDGQHPHARPSKWREGSIVSGLDARLDGRVFPFDGESHDQG